LAPDAWLELRPDGTIILQVDKAELGQGVVTAWVTLVAEELDVPPARITPELAPIHPLFQDPVQMTGESTSIIKRWLPLRKTGATARALLIQAAADRWQADPAALATDGAGCVLDPASGARAAYRDLLGEAALLPVPKSVPLKARREFRYIGGFVPRPDVPAKITGAAAYGLDTRLPGLLTALVARPPRLRAGYRSFDASAALALPGVRAVVPIHSGIAVLADTFWQATRGVAALQVAWEDGPLAGLDGAVVRRRQAAALDAERGRRARGDGDVDAAEAAAARLLEAEYATPYLAHATMEPMNATVWFHDGRCDAWVPSQGPDLVRQVICDMSGLRRAQVDVRTPYAGGGFGRRACLDYVVEAVAIALKSSAPVMLAWTREDDMRHGLFRQATLHRVRAALDERGQPVSWRHRMALAGLIEQILPPALATIVPEWLPDPLVRGAAAGMVRLADRFIGPFQARMGSVDMPYALDNVAVEIVTVDPGVPVTIWRSVGSSYNAFVVESFADELAHAAGLDPATWRRERLAGKPRHLAVLERLLAESRWGEPPPGRYLGLAIHEAFGSVTGQVAEVSVDQRRIQVHRVTCVIDCGSVVNPDIVRQQMEGGILFGLTAVLHGELTLRDGAIVEGNFDSYRMLRLADSPTIDVHIMDSDAEPGGVGEPGTPPIAPAVANAVFVATGQRLRELPLRLAVL
jgi:CO/xanthine dehydrogenase Mo-binding subunit